MFKSAKWKSERNKIKAVFKLHFHAAKVPSVGEDFLIVSVVPGDSGKPSAKSDKSIVREGSCLWENPVYETAKFCRDPKSGKLYEKIYYFVIGTGSSKSGVVGEASLDLSKYVEASQVTLVSLPLKHSKAEAVLNVSIQRMRIFIDQRVLEGGDIVISNYRDQSLRTKLSNGDMDEAHKSNSDNASINNLVSRVSSLSENRRALSGSDLTISSSGSSSGVEVPWQSQAKSNSFHQGLSLDTETAGHEESQRSQWEWQGNSCLEGSTDDSLSTPRENFVGLNMNDASDVAVEKLRSEFAVLSRQMGMSELELHTLRKQIVKESKKGQELFRELVCLKEERDSLRLECEKLKVSEVHMNGEGDKYEAAVEQLRQEVNHEKELSSSLRHQLQKAQETNSQFLLAVQDLKKMLQEKNQDSVKQKNGTLEKQNDQGLISGSRMDYEDVDKEQKALEELVKKEPGDSKDVTEVQIMRILDELEMCKRDKDELEMQMEQLALDYEIMKQENHEMANKLQQVQLREQLKMQYECSSSYAATLDLETQIEKLQDKVESQLNEYEAASKRIKDLEDHVKMLEDEIDKQAQGFEADLQNVVRCKIEQEQRAITAEEALRKARSRNANMAERLQEEFRVLSVQMTSTFEANEKLALKSLAEVSELRLQKACLEDMIKKATEENQSIKGQYESRLEQLAKQVDSLVNETKKLQFELADREAQLRKHKRNGEETKKLLSDEISKLKKENETHATKIRNLSEEMKFKENLMNEMKEKEERDELGNKVMPMKTEPQMSQKELSNSRYPAVEKDPTVIKLRSELDSLQSQNKELKNCISENKIEKDNLNKQIVHLKSELKKKEDSLSNMEKKMKAGIGRGLSSDAIKASPKPGSRGSSEVGNLKMKIKLLQGDVKSKETALEMASKAFLEKENNLLRKIQELEGKVDALSKNSISYPDNVVEKTADLVHDQDVLSVRNTHQDSNAASRGANAFHDDAMSETAQLKEKNKLMETELKEMQERYSEISLKFAEVEGERQQLVMKVRSLKNSQKAA